MSLVQYTKGSVGAMELAKRLGPEEAATPIFNSAYTTPNNILATALSTTKARTKYVIQATFVGAGDLSVTKTRSATTVTAKLGACSANTQAQFIVYVRSGETVNFTYSASTTITEFLVQQVQAGDAVK